MPPPPVLYGPLGPPFGGLTVRPNPTCPPPRPPEPGEVARRIVRHGFAAAYSDFEAWAGPVGPRPEEPVNHFLLRDGDDLHVHPETWRAIEAGLLSLSKVDEYPTEWWRP